MKIVDYTIIRMYEIENLEKKVRYMLRHEYILYGFPFSITEEELEDGECVKSNIICQAMVKYDKLAEFTSPYPVGGVLLSNAEVKNEDN